MPEKARWSLLIRSVCAAAALQLHSGCSADTPAELELPQADGRTANPFATTNTAAVAFVFIAMECPISNRYAPEVHRLRAKFPEIRFWVVYPNVAESDEAVRRHAKEFGHEAPVLRDPKHKLVRLARARVTPEAAVFSPRGELLYHGRIDDRQVDFGKERPEPTRRDLENALKAVRDGETPRQPAGRAVGCPIQ
jgi:hypothetical protein